MDALSLFICLLAVLAVAYVPIRLLDRYSWYDFGFMVTIALSVLYLFVSPTAALFGDSLEKVSARAGRYVLFELFALVLFIFPLTFLYAAVSRRHLRSVPAIDRVFSSTPILLLAVTSVVLRPLIATEYGLWRLRVGDAVAEHIVAVPFVVFSIFRAFAEIQFPLAALGVFLVLQERRLQTRRLGILIVGAHLLQCLLFAILNSRFAVLYLIVAAVFGIVQYAKPDDLVNRRIRRRAFLGFVGAYVLGLVVLALRSGRSRGGVNVVGDNQGLNRFNCADLIARTDILSLRAAPSPRVWGGYVWTFRRFIDPAGFDQFRLSLQTTAKSQISLRFLKIRQVDYFSCVATDAVGGLGIPGFLIAAMVIGCTLGVESRLVRRGTPLALAIAAFLLFHVLAIDQEFGALVFSWPLKMPGLVVLLVTARLCDRRPSGRRQRVTSHSTGPPPREEISA